MAAAVVTGAVALMLEKDPSLTPDTVKARLMRSAAKVDFADVFATGAGILDIQAALADTGVASQAPSPQAFRYEPPGQSDTPKNSPHIRVTERGEVADYSGIVALQKRFQVDIAWIGRPACPR